MPAKGEPGLEQAELKEIESELPSSLQRGRKVSREPASEPAGCERQLENGTRAGPLPIPEPRAPGQGGAVFPTSLSICLHVREN